MKNPDWLTEFHRQWIKARARRTEASLRSFRRDWEMLLDETGVTSREDQKAAEREARKMPQLRLIPFKNRPLYIDKIELPLESEDWLHARFGSQAGTQLLAQSLAVLTNYSKLAHPLFADLWQSFISTLETTFTASKSAGPFAWLEPDRLDFHLRLLWDITAREWKSGTLIRDASTAIGHPSKLLETHESALIRGLELLFYEETPLEALGIQTSQSVVHYCGPLVLHFQDHAKTLDLRFESTLSAAELEGVTRITTTAERLLTIENRKTTFLQFAQADVTRNTLIVATSFPTKAVVSLLEKLPADLPHYHFGDTDPSGWDILRRLREVSPRPVAPFAMRWRPQPNSKPLTARDHRILQRLLNDSHMADCHNELSAMLTSDSCGDFEQESLGPPTLTGWPFF